MATQQPVKPYTESGSKKQQVTRMFDKIAPYYDLLNRLLSAGIDRRWRKKAIEKLHDLQPKYILDVATGTGDLALQTYKQLAPEHITGVDISVDMLAVGKKKVEQKGLSDRITLQKGDAENLVFGDNTFDAITVGFGVRNFENLEEGLTEMLRVLRPGGRLMILEFSQPNGLLFRPLFQAYFRYALPAIGRLTSKDPRAYKYLYESVQAFPDGEQLMNIFRGVGFQPLEWQPLTFGICTIYTASKPA